jgi:glycosyltransferase involved in cell wall biosynthesis
MKAAALEAPGAEVRAGEGGATSAARAIGRAAIGWHGLPGYAARLVERLVGQQAGVSFTVLATKSADFQRHPRPGRIGRAEVHWVGERRRLRWSDLGLERPELFVFSSWCHPCYTSLAADARRRPGARLVCMMDNIRRPRARQWAGAAWFRLALRRRIDFLWVPGARARAFGRFLGMPGGRIVEGLYGADPRLFGWDGTVPEGGRSGVLFVGQLVERKGVPALVEAGRRDPAFAAELALAGDGPLAGAARQAGLKVHGFVPAEELAPLYRKASLVLLPSVVDHWGVVLHEAALAGCLLAATRECGAADDLIRHGHNGFVLSEPGPEEILRAVAWASRLTPAEAGRGRALSADLAKSFGPERFAAAFGRFLR